MHPSYPRISVLMITYNQENYVSRALDSLLEQRDFIFEICINDDCSSDRTYDILEEYGKRFPNIIKPIRNHHNLGIFQNIEATWSRPSGDLVYRLAGDDECGPGYLKAVINFIIENKIDWKNELFCIYGDYKEIEPNGNSVVYKNSMVRSHDALKLKIRKLLSNRSACFSKGIMDKYEKVCEGRSYNAEMIQEGQLALFSEKNYYIPVVGNIYYAGIGVSTRMSKKEQYDNIFSGYQRFTEFVSSHGHPFDEKDMAFIEYMKAYRSKDMLLAIKFYLKSIDLSLGVKGLNLNRISFVIQKKLAQIKV